MNGLFDNSQTLYIHVDDEKGIVDAVNFSKNFNIKNTVIIGGYQAHLISDFLVQNNIPVLIQHTHSLPNFEDEDYNSTYLNPKKLIDAGVLVNISESNINELIQSLKDKEFTNVRKWIVHNLDNDAVRIFRRIYDSLYDNLDGSTIPHVVVILAEYQYKAAFVSDQEINLLACMTEIMGQAKFK